MYGASFISTEYSLGQTLMVQSLVEKMRTNGSVAIGFHGTSAGSAEAIGKSGFENRAPVRGVWSGRSGVYFWDKGWANNALGFGKDRACEINDDTFAVIEAHLRNPDPDWEHLRLEWFAHAGDIAIRAIRYYDLESEELKYIDEFPAEPTPLSTPAPTLG